jgi:hypothetical protein
MISEELRYARWMTVALCAEIAAYFPIKDWVEGGSWALVNMVAVLLHTLISLTVLGIGVFLVEAAYHAGYMTYEDFRCLFPRQRLSPRIYLHVFLGGVSMSWQCFARAWEQGRFWPTVQDATNVLHISTERYLEEAARLVKEDDNDDDDNDDGGAA